MVKKQYTVERVGQMDFFDNYRVPYNDDASVLVDNTDGVYHGNILEFKLNINNTGKVILKNHLDHCIVEAVEQNDMETIRALDEAIDKFIK